MTNQEYALRCLEAVEKPTILFKGVPIEKFCQDDIIKILGLMQMAAENNVNIGKVIPKDLKFTVGQQVHWNGGVAIIQGLQPKGGGELMAHLRVFGQSGQHVVNTKLLVPYVKKEGGPEFDF